MKKLAASFMFVAAAALFAGSNTTAQEKGKEVTLKGTITCAKCDLKVEGVKKCATVIVTKKKDKEVVFYFDKTSDKKYHSDICTAAKKGSVTGTVSKDGKKLVIAVKDLKYD